MEQKVALGVGDPKLMRIHLRIHVTISHKDVFPSVVVVVEESNPKPQKGHTDGGETRGAAEIVEGPVAVVVIEVVRVVGKICFHQVQPSVVVVIAKIHTHAGLLASVSAEGDSGRHAHFGESPIPVVVVEKTGGRIVGHV